MRSSPVVKVEISTNRASRLTDGFVGSQIDLLVFDAFPKPLDEHVVSPSSFAIHADGDAVVGEDTGKGRSGELRALVGVEDVRPAVTRESIFQRLDAEGRLHRDRQPPRQNTTCRPVEHHGDRAPLSPSAASASSHAGGRPCTPAKPAGLATYANRRKDTPGAADRAAA